MNADIAAIVIGIVCLAIYAGFRIRLTAERRRQRDALRAAYERKDGGQT